MLKLKKKLRKRFYVPMVILQYRISLLALTVFSARTLQLYSKQKILQESYTIIYTHYALT